MPKLLLSTKKPKSRKTQDLRTMAWGGKGTADGLTTIKRPFGKGAMAGLKRNIAPLKDLSALQEVY